MTDFYPGSKEATKGRAYVISGSDMRQHELALLIDEAGQEAVDGRVIVDGKDGTRSSKMTSSDLLIIDIPSILEKSKEDISNISFYLQEYGAGAVVLTDMDGLDLAYGALPVAQCHFLVEMKVADALPVIVNAMGRNRMDQLHDNSRTSELGDLNSISDQLADFAERIAKIAKQDDDEPKGIRNALSDKPMSFRPAQQASASPFIEEAPDIGSIDPEKLRSLIRARRLRDRFFGEDLFADPAWDILLDLMASRLERRRVSVSSLCIAAAVPPTTALRWITGMTEAGMLERHLDPDDARRVFIELSEKTVAMIENYFDELDRIGSPAV